MILFVNKAGIIGSYIKLLLDSGASMVPLHLNTSCFTIGDQLTHHVATHLNRLPYTLKLSRMEDFEKIRIFIFTSGAQ